MSKAALGIEILAEGKNVTLEYWNAPEESAKCFAVAKCELQKGWRVAIGRTPCKCAL
jgi:hypothetical protein